MKKIYPLNPNCHIDITNGDSIKSDALLELLNCNSFKKLAITNNEYILVQLVNGCIIQQISDFVLKDAVVQYLKGRNQNQTANLFINRNYFNKNLITSLETVEYKLHTGDKNTAYLYYKNGVLKITKENTEIIPYNQFNNYLWNEQVIDREILSTLSSNFDNFCFNKFLWNVANQKPERYFSLVSIIGYLLHNFKDRKNTKAIIISDENIDIIGDSANGGPGKSLFALAICKMTSVCKKEGKNIETGNRFFFQEIEHHNSILYFDDVNQDFYFECLYSVITGDITVEKKYKTPITIPFEQAPKILISSNYIVGGRHGFTDERRRYDFEFSSYYNKDRSPASEFGYTFFDEWDNQNWHMFDSFMIYCIQFYLTHGLFETTKIRLDENKIIQSTHPTFFEFAKSNLIKDQIYNKKTLYNSYLNENKDEIGTISQNTFKKWLDAYVIHYKKWEMDHYKSNGNYMIKIF